MAHLWGRNILEGFARCVTARFGCPVKVRLAAGNAWLSWQEKHGSPVLAQCGGEWQAWYTRLHADMLQRPLSKQRLAVAQVTFNGLGDRLASLVSVFYFAMLTGALRRVYPTFLMALQNFFGTSSKRRAHLPLCCHRSCVSNPMVGIWWSRTSRSWFCCLIP